MSKDFELKEIIDLFSSENKYDRKNALAKLLEIDSKNLLEIIVEGLKDEDYELRKITAEGLETRNWKPGNGFITFTDHTGHLKEKHLVRL